MSAKKLLMLLALASPAVAVAQSPIPPGNTFDPFAWIQSIMVRAAGQTVEQGGYQETIELDTGTYLGVGASSPSATMEVDVQVDTGTGMRDFGTFTFPSQ